MPLLKGKSNIGHNIKVEEEHGKPRKQAVAIALRTAGVPKKGKDAAEAYKGFEIEQTGAMTYVVKLDGRPVTITNSVRKAKNIIDNLSASKGRDEVLHVGGDRDRERAVALKKHELGLTKSQDAELEGKVVLVGGEWFYRKPNDALRYGPYKSASEAAEAARKAGVRVGDTAAEPITGFEKGGGTATRNCARCRYMAKDSGCDQPVMVKKSEQPKNAEGLPIVEKLDVCKFFKEAKDMRAKDVLPVPIKTSNLVPLPSGERNEVSYAAPRRATDASQWQPDSPHQEILGDFARRLKEGGYRWLDTSGMGKGHMRHRYVNKKNGAKAYVNEYKHGNHTMTFAEDEVAPVGDALSREQAEELARLRAAKKKRTLTEAETRRFYELRKIGARPANDSESAWRLLQAGKRLEERGLLKSASKTFSEAVSAAVEERDEEARREATAAVARIRHKEAGTARAQDHSGSEPKDHLTRAKRYEIGGDRALALDSYRAAASGYRRANDRSGEAEAREGIEACQARFAQQYDHPGRGHAKVCDSAESALRTALERTRAGERVHITDGRMVRPGRARAEDSNTRHAFVPSGTDREACEICGRERDKGDHTRAPDERAELEELEARARREKLSNVEHARMLILRKKLGRAKDEHEGFAKLEHSLAHEKGVSDPRAVAAAIGRKKYGAAGMARKAAVGRAKDYTTEQAARDNCVRAERAIRRGLITEGTVYAQRAAQQAKQLGHTAILARAEELLKRAKEAHD